MSRRAERGDFVAQRGEIQKSDQRPNNSEAKVTKDLQFQRRSSSFILQRPHSGDKLSKLAV